MTNEEIRKLSNDEITKKIESQMKNLFTTEMYKEQFVSLAMNVFLFKNLK